MENHDMFSRPFSSDTSPSPVSIKRVLSGGTVQLTPEYPLEDTHASMSSQSTTKLSHRDLLPTSGGWYAGLEVYLLRIVAETSVSIGIGSKLKNKRVRAADSLNIHCIRFVLLNEF